MPRLTSSAISLELRSKLAQATFTSFTLAEIPTGRDPRRLQESDNFPMLMVHVSSSITAPHGIGGSAKAWHGLCIYWADVFGNTDDIATKKQLAAEEIFDFICDNYCGDTYMIFVSDKDGESRGWPDVDYEPQEELQYGPANIALLKMSFAVRQLTTFSIR